MHIQGETEHDYSLPSERGEKNSKSHTKKARGQTSTTAQISTTAGKNNLINHSS